MFLSITRFNNIFKVIKVSLEDLIIKIDNISLSISIGILESNLLITLETNRPSN